MCNESNHIFTKSITPIYPFKPINPFRTLIHLAYLPIQINKSSSMHMCSAFNHHSSISLHPEISHLCHNFVLQTKRTTATTVIITATAKSSNNTTGDGVIDDVRGSGTTARGRRLLKVREEKRKREYDRIHNYPSWAKVLEDAAKNDVELRNVLGDSIGKPEQMRQKVEDRIRKKGRDFHKAKTGSVVAFKVTFRDFSPVGSNIWFKLYGPPSDKDVDLIGSVIQSWYVLGRLGAYNSSNLQLANASMEYNPLYDADKGFSVMPSSFHDISDVEFQDNWGRVWVDIGTSDYFALDVLLNCLTVLSSEYLGIQQVVFGGRSMGDWEEGMKNPEDGYKYFKI